MYLNKCFQMGETPVPGPLTGEDGEQNDEFGGIGGYSSQAGSSGGGAAGGYGSDHTASYSAPSYPPAAVPTSPSQYNQLNAGVSGLSINRPGSSHHEVSNANTVNEESKSNYSTGIYF
jgi:hypothetical protein